MAELRYRLHWARSYLKGVGAINNSERGVWTLTDAGEYVTPDDIAAIKKSVRTKRYELRKRRQASALEDDPDDVLDWT